MKIFIYLAAALAIVSLLACSSGKDESGPKETFKVRLGKTEKRPFSSEENYVGAIRSKDTVNISTKMMGRLLSLHVNEGSVVKKGQLLAEVDAAEALSAFRQSDAGLRAAEINAGNLERDLERFRRLFEEKAVTRQQLEQMEAGAAAAKAQMEQAAASLQMSKTLLSYGKLYSPVDGVVTKKWIETGNLAYPGMPILTVENPGSLEVLVEVPENKSREIAAGSGAKIFLEDDGRSVDTVVAAVVPAADAFTKTSTVRLEVPNEPGIVPGQFARVRFKAFTKEFISIPSGALRKQGQLESVFVRDDKGLASLRIIRSGRSEDGFIQALSGLAGGETVVVDPPEALAEGMKLEEGQ
ncbi:MAG TPA: efflux RND transporter periplasmic adaptor subunit [Acidobacteriota bacterium]|nr:efflux RND transporter periplasmic adaptor subunit [Acidobacteriota bacterium]